MANAQKPQVTKEEITHAHDLWVGFTKFMTYGTLGMIVFITLLALLTL